ncbi:chorismate-binding protein [Novosphingobium sp. KN65.2]|uniref:chorismate-binding protein n=1 Tax=Novosphingobium sp. KN65.2 TaxID=1478134 RepID=UPI0006D57C6E|nr:chorismate-binding protein [Novosphingobium sp. KN65.2]
MDLSGQTYPEGWSIGAGQVADIQHTLLTEYGLGRPFVLLDDQARDKATILTDLEEEVFCDRLDQVESALLRIDALIARGRTLAGFLSYGAAPAFDRFAVRADLTELSGRPAPLLWFGVFGRQTSGPLPLGASLHECALAGGTRLESLVTQRDFEAGARSVLESIASGEIYQANLTFPTRTALRDPLATYCRIRSRAKAPLGAMIATGERHVLSFSPELFFRLEGNQLQARPMKGTRPRHPDPVRDRQLHDELLGSPKDRAENLMILDLLRNDMSRVSEPGSVRCPALFDIEGYPSVWQMTSTVRSRVRAGVGAMDILKALFPCGSIVGAPKIRASEVIARVETFGRGLYTGALGVLGKDRAMFNVAIRTMDVTGAGEGYTGRLDVGCGIVADSVPALEWEECLAKARFAGEVREPDLWATAPSFLPVMAMPYS